LGYVRAFGKSIGTNRAIDVFDLPAHL